MKKMANLFCISKGNIDLALLKILDSKSGFNFNSLIESSTNNLFTNE